ncbi:hypothetical protein Tco_0730325 [Tanacetum coccineum]|uniref:Uncharacterized protein n=1 Tax=Tanacetum coccineum TaxID=301880 RepID=A0ABQ4YRH3_9ASTR
MMHSISPCYVFILAMSAYSFNMHHLASRLPSILHASCMVSYKGDLYKLLLVQVMVALTIPVSVDSAQWSFVDMIDIGVDIIHPKPVATVAFPASAVVRTLAQHEEAIRGIHEHLLGVPIQEELAALRFRVDIAEAKNALLRARIKTMEAVEKITRNHERLARIGIEQQLASVQESHRQDREDFRKLKEFVTILLLFESTAHYAQSTARCESTAVMFEVLTAIPYREISYMHDFDGFESQCLFKGKIRMAPVFGDPMKGDYEENRILLI